MKIKNKEENYRSETKKKTFINNPNIHSIKKGGVSVFDAEANQNDKEVPRFFLDGFDSGMEFKVYFPQFNFGKILQKLNNIIESISPIHKSKIKSPRRLFQKKIAH